MKTNFELGLGSVWVRPTGFDKKIKPVIMKMDLCQFTETIPNSNHCLYICVIFAIKAEFKSK